jgi:hypothetical protein
MRKLVQMPWLARWRVVDASYSLWRMWLWRLASERLPWLLAVQGYLAVGGVMVQAR